MDQPAHHHDEAPHLVAHLQAEQAPEQTQGAQGEGDGEGEGDRAKPIHSQDEQGHAEQRAEDPLLPQHHRSPQGAGADGQHGQGHVDAEGQGGEGGEGIGQPGGQGQPEIAPD